jgi:type I restriction enzyme S subunit
MSSLMPMLQYCNIKTGKLDSNAAMPDGEYPFFTCAPETLRINKYAFDEEAVLLAGNNASGVFPVKYFSGKFNAYQRTYILTTKSKSQLATRFLFYALQLQLANLQNLSTGAATKFLTLGILKQIYIPLPVITTQVKIVECLSAYDDLIATNQRRIALLEDAARRIYREWFVHLRFPGHESVPVNDGVPEGWQLLPLTSVADFINGFAFKPEHQQAAGFPIVKIPELRDGINTNTPRNSGTAIPPRNHINTGDVLFSWSATLLVNEWGGGPALLNQHLFKIVPKNPTHKRLIRFAVETAIPLLLGQSVGATMQHIRRSALDTHWMLVPDQPVTDAFTTLVDPMMDIVLNLQMQNGQLTAARDLLLPKLMSGQLDVSGIALPGEAAA